MKAKKRALWWVYLLECADGTLYCGSTSDLSRRITQHKQGKGAKYTRGRSPVKLLFKKRAPTKAKAFSIEYRIKQLSRKEKLNLIKKRETHAKAGLSPLAQRRVD